MVLAVALSATANAQTSSPALELHDEAVDLISGCRVDDQAGARAAELFGRARELHLAAGDRRGAADSSSDLATLFALTNRWREAAEAERWALEVRREELPAHHPEIAESLLGLSYALSEQGRFDQVEPLLLEARDVFAKNGDDLGVAEALNALGELRRVEDRLDDAQWLLESALSRALGDDLLYASVLNNRAGLHKDRGEHRLAELRLRESLEMRKALPDPCPGALATAFLNLAEVLRLQQEHEQAAPHYADALAFARRAFDARNPELAWFLNQNGVFEKERGNLARAEALLEEALAITRGGLPDHHLLIALALHDLADVRLARGEVAAAETLLREALDIRGRVLGAGHPELVDTLLRLAEAAALAGRPEERVALLERARGIVDGSDLYPESRAVVYQALAVVMEAGGDLAGALELQIRALDLLEPLRAFRGGGEAERLGLLDDLQSSYHRAFRWAVLLGRSADAFALAERGRARVFLDELANAGGGGNWPGATQQHREGLELRRQRAAAGRAAVDRELGDRRVPAPRADEDRLRHLLAERQRWQRELDALDRELRSASVAWRLTGLEILPLRRAGQVLGSASWLLIYQIGPDDGALLAVPRGGEPRIVPLVVAAADSPVLGVEAGPLSHSRLEAALVEAHRHLATPPAAREEAPPRRVVDTQAALFRTLLPGDLWSLIVDAEEVVVVPAGPLFALPFESLVVAAEGDDVTWWIDRGPAVRYSSSATILANLEERRRSLPAAHRGDILSVSGVDLPGQIAAHLSPCPAGDWRPAPLPGSERETRRLIELFGVAEAGGEVLALQGERAVEPAVRDAMGDARWLHFATHGIAGTEPGRPCAALVLAQPREAAEPASGESDGFLTADEIQAMELRAELAVLSACSTHAGPAVAGESLLALSRAFLLAGASRVLASTWRVDDAATAELVSSLFAALGTDAAAGRSPRYGRALREAKLRLRAEPRWAHPYFWAPLVLSGVE